MRYILGTFLLALSVAGTAFAQCSDADKKALEAFDRAWGKAGQTGDKVALGNFYADDFNAMPAMLGKADTIANTMATYERNKAANSPADVAVYDRYLFSCTPNSATITHRNTFTDTGANGKPETFYSRSVHFLEKRGGNWQVVSTTGHEMDDSMIIGYLEQDWNDAVVNRDKAWFEKHLANDFSGIGSSTGKLTNKAQDIADTVEDKGKVTWAETTDMNINVDGNFAKVTGIFHLKGTDEKGAAFDRKIRYTDVFIKRDGQWLAWSSQGTDIK